MFHPDLLSWSEDGDLLIEQERPWSQISSSNQVVPQLLHQTTAFTSICQKLTFGHIFDSPKYSELTKYSQISLRVIPRSSRSCRVRKQACVSASASSSKKEFFKMMEIVNVVSITW